MTSPKHLKHGIDHTPATSTSSWRFGDLSGAALLPLLRQHLLAQDANANWQWVWLNNDDKPVIGLLPKVSWSVYFNNTDTCYNSSIASHTSDRQASVYKIIKTYRDDSNAVTIAYTSYIEWQDELIAYSKAYEDSAIALHTKTAKPSYHQGLIGFVGYDMSAHELSPAANIELARQPCAFLGHYDTYLTPIDNEGQIHWSLMVTTSTTEAHQARIQKLMSYLDALDRKLSGGNPVNDKRFETSSTPPFLALNAQWTHLDYQQAFDLTQDYLQLGDCYQINLTQKWSGCLPYKTDANQPTSALIDYLPALHRNTQAPFAGYLGIDRIESDGSKGIDFELLSCSPELFFTFIKDDETGAHHILTKPIKGTMPRGSTDEQDESYKQQLIDSEKDRAENVMIVDLLRNDLGKYAKTGSVKVPHLFTIESFSNVHHMVSTITAELKQNTHPLAVLFGSLPAGSITGTPKKRAVEIISELEAAPRGAYCGTMGYMNFDGSGQWNVLIRTLQTSMTSNETRNVSLWAGGGITIASDCDAEYQECLDKVGNLLAVLAQNRLSSGTSF